MMPRVSRRAAAIPFLVLLCGVAAHAQGPVLHEYVPDVSEDEAAVLITPGQSEPAGIVYDGEVLPVPDDGALGPDERPLVATPATDQSRDYPGRRSPTFRPDRLTDLESTLGYFAVFTPTIAPFKRMSALDTVTVAPEDGRTPVLVVGDTTTRPVPIVGATAPSPDDRPRDRFWGSVVLDFSAGRVVPLPSVSPESRILTLRTEPLTGISIQKDRADNYFAVAVGPVARNQVRLIFLTDAPRSYFNTPIPEVASDSLASEVAPLPQSVQRSAETFAAELGLRRGESLPKALSILTSHFRSFEESRDPPADSGDIYLDLARGMKGVCRHRAYAFMITALGLGIPTRFVMNEAHSWVEVLMPSVGWMRIDLGGAAQGLEAHNAQDRPVYRPVLPDPLPRPEPYLRSYSQLRSDVNGLRTSPGADPGSARPGPPGPGAASFEDGPPRGPGPSPRPDRPGASEARLPLLLTLDRSRQEVFRGRALSVSGLAATDSGAGVAGLRIEVVLRGERELLLGVTVSRENGVFAGSFGVPPDLPVGEYRLLVRTPGSRQYAASLAR